jgi:hypothetical protein
MDQAVFKSKFDGENLSNVIKEIQEDTNLQAIDAIDDVVEALSLLTASQNSYILSEADDLVIYRGGINLIYIKNSKHPNSGNSIRIEINSCRLESSQLIQTVKEKSGEWLYTLGAVATFLLSGWTFYKNI